MKTILLVVVAGSVAAVAGACSVRTETVERPPATAAVVTAPAPSTVVYTDTAQSTSVTIP
jgi:hypothetical protein